MSMPFRVSTALYTYLLVQSTSQNSIYEAAIGKWRSKRRIRRKQFFKWEQWAFMSSVECLYGLCNAPVTFQRLMERCMGEINMRDCLIYLDDIIIFSSTVEEHLERLEAVFSRLAEHNSKLKASKCEFLRSRATYLGQVVSEDGIETDPEKTEALKTWSVPTSVKDVRAFLGFTGYYRKLLKDYAKIARPLNDLLFPHWPTLVTKCHRGGKTTWPDRDSNPGPLENRASTLTTELPSHTVDLWQFPPA